MKRIILSRLALFVMLALFAGCQSLAKSDPYGLADKTHEAVTPADRSYTDWWISRHEQVLERIAQGNVDLVMVGDSITHGWDRVGKAMWDRYYAPRNAVNMGFSGDRTQHVLWRFKNGEIDGINPRLAVLMIGTNNSNRDDYSAEEIADGIKAICAEMRLRMPETRILILAIFPRALGNRDQRTLVPGGAGFNPQWAKTKQASLLAAGIADDEMVYFLDINEAFLDENGVLTREVMPDLLHLSEKGYKIWAEAMEPTIRRLMGED